MELPGKPSVIKMFSGFQETIFYGLEKKALVGANYSLKVQFTSFSIDIDNAHNELITDIEYLNINNAHYFFTGSLDKSVKVWTPSPDGKNLNLVANQPMP